jgi:hypothetical protein
VHRSVFAFNRPRQGSEALLGRPMASMDLQMTAKSLTDRREHPIGCAVGAHMRNLYVYYTAALLLVAAAFAPLRVEAGALKANVFLTQNKIPGGLTESGLLGFVRSHKAARLRETSETAIEERKFMAEMVTQFNSPPGDLEFHVLFYDIHDGARQFVEDMATFIDDKKQKVFLQRVKLPRPRFKPNRRMELVVTVKRSEVGSLKFITDGEEKRHSGTVSFDEKGQ